MKFSIIVGGRAWSFQLAESLSKLDRLDFLITSYPKYYVKKYKVPDNKIKSIFFLYILQKFLLKLRTSLFKLKIKYDLWLWGDWLADSIFSSFFVKKSDFLLLGIDGGSSCRIIKNAKSKNIKTI